MKNRRKTIVINKQFQYQYSLLIAAMAVLLINAFIIFRMLFPGEEPLIIDTVTALGVASLEMALIASIWYVSLHMSHRIAGPMYVIAREVAKLGEGDLTARIHLRERDMFKPEAEKINASIADLSTRIVAAKGLSEQLKNAQAAGEEIGPLIEKLDRELAAFTLGDE